jgi:esterase FrsA
LVCLAHSGAETLQTSPYRASGLEVARQGWLVVSVDLPGHGAEHRVGEPAGIAAWGDRIKQNQPFVDDLAKRVSAVVDFLVQEGYADPARLAIEGTSRGGFMAAHVAAREPRFKSLAMYAPVCDLADVTEFHGLEQNSQLQALALSKVADKLADRRIWLIIGNDDRRVNTDRAIQFTRDVVRAAKRRKLAPAVTLIVPATPGHSSTEAMHHEAVEWLTRKSAASRP